MGLQTLWGWPPGLYFFLGGLGAGTFCVVAVIGLLTGDRFKSTLRFGAWASAIAIALGSLILLLDVGAPLRAAVLFQSFVNFGSWMTIGAWLLFAAILLNGLYALLYTDRVISRFQSRLKLITDRLAVWRTLLALVGIPLNLAVAIYTGILLGVLPFRPFWNTWILPALFVASALETGVGLVTAYATLREKGERVARLRFSLEILVLLLIPIEGIVLGYYLTSMLGGTT